MLDIALKDMADHACEGLAKLNKTITYHDIKGELVFKANAGDILDVLQYLKDDHECSLNTLIDVTAIDWLGMRDGARFEVIYNLLSMDRNIRARVHVDIKEDAPMQSATKLWDCANWYEREVWDMYGIPFSGHTDLRRMLCDYDFEGHAQRKDFPMYGNVEVRYDPAVRRVTYDKIELNQEYRKFDTMSPWQAMTNVQVRLPGDEKAAEK